MIRVLAAVRRAGVLLVLACLGAAADAHSAGPAVLSGADREFLARHWRRPIEGRITTVSRAPFQKVAEALERAIAEEKMGLVCRANAQLGAASRGVTIKGNQVFMVFRPDFAVRLLAADPRAGFEGSHPHLYESPDGTATLSYVPPSAVFASYRNPEVQAIGAELDPIFKAIVDRALAAR